MYTKILNYQKWERVEVTDDFKIMTNRAILSIKDEDKESFKNSIEYILKQLEYFEGIKKLNVVKQYYLYEGWYYFYEEFKARTFLLWGNLNGNYGI